MVSPLSILAKVSLRATAYFLDLTLESTRLVTGVSIDLARRGLTSAITAANGMQWTSEHRSDDFSVSRLSGRASPLSMMDPRAPLAVAERYSIAAICLIDHGLSLAELLAMSAISLAQDILRNGVFIAHRGVHTLDEISGSTGSSRALAVFIQLCRLELSVEACPVTGGGITALVALIKGIITFAVVQRATHHRTIEAYEMKLLHEGVVIDRTEDRHPSSRSCNRTSACANESVSANTSTAQTSFTLQERHGLDRDSQSQSTFIRRYQLEDLPSIPSQSDSVYGRSSTLFSSETNVDQPSTVASFSRNPRPQYAESIREPAAPAKTGRYGSLIDERDWLKAGSLVTHDGPKASHSPLQVATANQQTGKYCRLFRHRSSPTGITPEWKQKLGRLQRRCTRGSKTPEKGQSKHDGADESEGFQEVSYEESTPTRQPTKRREDLREFWLHPPSLSVLSDDEDSVSSSPLKLASMRHRRQQSEPHGPIVPYRVSSLKRSAVAPRTTEPAIEVVMPTIASIESVADLEQANPSSDASSHHDPDAYLFLSNMTLVERLRHFMKYASASSRHGLTASMGQHTRDPDVSDIAFAHHAGVEVNDVLLSRYTPCNSKAPVPSTQVTPSVYITLDHANQAVVLTCGGELAIPDLLLNLDYEHIETELGSGAVHKGFFISALRVLRSNKVMAILRKALEDHPGYGLVLTGHSVGGSTAAMAALLLSCPAESLQQQRPRMAQEADTSFVTSSRSGLPSGRPIHCYGYGSAAVFDPELCTATEGLVTTVVLDNDLIPSISLGMLRDLRHISEMLEYQSSSTTKDERPGSGVLDILSRVIGLDQITMTSRPQGRDHTTNGSTMSDPDTSLDSTDRPGIHDVFRPCHVNRTDKATPSFDFFSCAHLEDRPVPAEQDEQAEHPEECLQDWLWSLMKTMRAHAQHDKLYPPGRVYCMDQSEVYVKDSEGRSKKANRVHLSQCEDVVARFSEPVFCGSMLRDHMPWNYESCLDLSGKSLSFAGSDEGKEG